MQHLCFQMCTLSPALAPTLSWLRSDSGLILIIDVEIPDSLCFCATKTASTSSKFLCFSSSREPAEGACCFFSYQLAPHILIRARSCVGLDRCCVWNCSFSAETCAELYRKSVCCWDLWRMAADADGNNSADESLCSEFTDLNWRQSSFCFYPDRHLISSVFITVKCSETSETQIRL